MIEDDMCHYLDECHPSPRMTVYSSWHKNVFFIDDRDDGKQEEGIRKSRGMIEDDMCHYLDECHPSPRMTVYSSWHKNVFFIDDRDDGKQEEAIRRADANYCQHERNQQRKRHEIQRTKKQKICIEKDIQAIEAQVPLLNRIVANNALAEFRNNISCNSLRELTCAVCSVNKYLEKPFFEDDFVYGHPCIDKSGYKILFDRNRFVKNNDNENPFDLRLCNNCKQSLKAGNTPIFSLEQLRNVFRD
ncbi:hypothetical protein Glove_139g94 [Diversispora epigaea]|uniref:Uncharacterized protein n=1 Tax=Diversispora epigaea TaxID=1348612 RepID=A0A397IZJ3_9GLOM|nr:hypothetical protein Glove_139g94 [Diversispora epigaea]